MRSPSAGLICPRSLSIPNHSIRQKEGHFKLTKGQEFMNLTRGGTMGGDQCPSETEKKELKTVSLEESSKGIITDLMLFRN